jgi:hypothetical protein
MGAVATFVEEKVTSVGNALGDAIESGAKFIGGDDGLFDKIGDAAGKVVSSVGNAVSDVGNFVIDKVVEPVGEAVGKTVQAAIDDPIGTAVKIAAISTGNPYIIAAANTGVALANGAEPEDALKAGAKAAVFYEVGSAVGEYVGPEAAAYFGPENAAAASAVTNAAASTVAAAVVGEDPYQALLASGVNSAAGSIAKQVPGYDSLSVNQQRALKTTIAASLEGKDPSQALVNQALQVGINYVKNDPEIQNIIPAPAERKPTTQEEVDALINGGLTEDDGSNYGYEQAPDFAPEIDKKPTEVITAPVTTELPAPDSDTNLSEAQKDYLESSMAGGDDEVIADILDRQLSPLVPGDATPLPPVTGVDLTEENIVPEGVERPPATQEEVDALIDSGLTEDTGIDYGYEQAPDFIPDTSEELPEAVTPPTKDEISDLVDSGLVEDAGLDYGYEQAAPKEVAPPVEQTVPEEVAAPVDVGLTKDAGLDYGYEQAPDLSPIVEGDASPFPPVTNVDLTAENIVPEGVDRIPTTQDEVDALIDSGLVETPAPPVEENLVEPPAPPVESGVPTAFDTGESLSEVVVTPPPEDDLEPLIDSGLVEQPPSFVADYNLSTGKDPFGLDPSSSGLGLQKPESPNLESMGGGQGLTAPAFGKPGGTVSEEGVFYDYNPLTGNVAPRISPVRISSGAKPAPIQRRPTQANTLDDLMSMMQGAPITSTEQEELIKLVKASPYFNISNPLDIGFFDMPTNQDPVKMAEGGYMDIFFPKTQLTMDEILQILEGK